MSRERWWRGDRGDPEADLDWQALADERGLSHGEARALYRQAVTATSRQPGLTRAVYLQLLRQMPPNTAIAPGKRSLVARTYATPGSRQTPAPGGTPGKRTRTETIPLPESTRTRMERAFGDRFDQVRIHPESPEATGSVRALSRGDDIHFRPGAYAPGTEQGDRVIAHELAHLAQRRSTGNRPAGHRALEADADRAASRVMAGKPARVTLQANWNAVFAWSDDQDHDEPDDEQRRRKAKQRGQDERPGESEKDNEETATEDVEAESDDTTPDDGQADQQPPVQGRQAEEQRPRGDGPVDRAVAAADGDAAAQVMQDSQRARGAEQSSEDGEDGDRETNTAEASDTTDGDSDQSADPGSDPDTDQGAGPGSEPDTDEGAVQGPRPRTESEGAGTFALPESGGGDIDFAESDVDGLIPQQPDEPPEVHAQRVAQVRHSLAGDRAHAIERLSDFRATQHQRFTALSATAPEIDEFLAEAEERAASQITQAAAAQARVVRAEVSRALAQARNAAATARAEIRAEHTASCTALEAATAAARGEITGSYQQALTTARAAENGQIAALAGLYGQAENAFRAAATAAGSHALSVAAGRARTYRAGRINRDDSVLDGALTDNRCEARAEAAEKVGEAYRDELGKEGENQVVELRQRKPTDEAAVRQIAAEARRNLETAYRESLRGLEEGRRRALASAGQVRDGALAGTARTLQQTISGLRRHERAQVAGITRQAAAGKQALQQQRVTAATRLRGALDSAISDLAAGVDQSIAAMGGAQVPEREALDQTLARSDQAIENQMAQLRSNIEQGREQVAEALGQAATQATQGLVRTGTAATVAAQQTGAGAVQALAQGAQQAATSLQQTTVRHQSSTAQSAAGAQRGFAGINGGLSQAYGQLAQNLQQGMQRNADAVRTGLTEVVDRDMGATVTEEARKAAAQVQPRWKSVLKWVIIIAIVLVVAIVLGPMVIGAVTGLAAGLGASAAVAGVVGAVVGGAIVGAGTAAVTTVVDNGFAGRTGWDLFQGVGTAMAWGALGGALGGGLSAVLSGPIQGMSALARFGVQVGVDVGLDTAISAVTGNLSWENFGTSLMMSMLVNGVTAHPRVQSISESAMSRGYGAGFEGGIGLRNRLPGAQSSPGPVSFPADRLEHVARGDSRPPTSPYAGDWTVKQNGGGHVPGEIIPRADAQGVPHSTRANDPVTGVSLERFIRPSGATTDKSLFPPNTTRAHVDAMATEGLNRALTGAPGSTHTPANNSFTAVVQGPDGHPLVVRGFYRPDGAGGFAIQSIFPQSDPGTATIPVVGGTGLGGSRSLPTLPTYATPPATSEDR